MSDTATKTPSLQELYDKAATMRQEFAAMDEGTRSDEDTARIRHMVDEVYALDAQITLAEREERRLHGGGLASTAGGFRGDGGGMDFRSLGELIVTEEFVESVLRSGSPAPVPPGEVRGPQTLIDGARAVIEDQGSIAELMTRSLQVRGRNSGTRSVAEWGASGPPNLDPTGSGYLLPVGQPIPPVPRQAKLYLRDLLPSMQTTLAQVPYVQEVTPTATELGASAVAEGGTKPSASLDFIGQKADPTVLATTLVLSKQLFQDAAAVVQYINQRLPYLVKFKEDWEFLNGTGTWPDILGIKNQTNVQTRSGAGDNAVTLGNSIADLELADGACTFVVLNPTNAWTMFTKRASTSGIFDAGTPFSALPLTIWGVPTYRTRAMTLNTALAADGERGAMIVDREQVNVQTYQERYAEINQVLLVCEERVGLAVWRPDLFEVVSSLS